MATSTEIATALIEHEITAATHYSRDEGAQAVYWGELLTTVLENLEDDTARDATATLIIDFLVNGGSDA